MDGSTFYKTPGLARKMEAYLAELLDAHNIEFTLIQVEDAPARGGRYGCTQSARLSLIERQ